MSIRDREKDRVREALNAIRNCDDIDEILGHTRDINAAIRIAAVRAI
jgi:hypothetical protein